jgi:hypothetical protein
MNNGLRYGSMLMLAAGLALSARAQQAPWAYKLRKLNGPHFTWPMLMFASALPESVLQKAGRIYKGKPVEVKTRKELLKTIRPNHWRHLREDTGDVPVGAPPEARVLAVRAV